MTEDQIWVTAAVFGAIAVVVVAGPSVHQARRRASATVR
jgi:hypothetical protein